MNKIAGKMKDDNIVEKLRIEYKKLNLCGEIDLLIENEKEDDIIVEIKCTKDIYIRHYLQLLLYNFIYSDNITKKYNTVVKILNFYTGKETTINLKISSANMFKIMNIISDLGHLKFTNMNFVYDLETTGLIEVKNKQQIFPEILQISIRDYDSDMLIYNNYVKPNKKITEEITKITGITNDMVKSSPDLTTTKKWLQSQLRNIEDMRMIAHNGNRFDKLVLENYKMISKNIKINYTDTMSLIPLHTKQKVESRKLASLYTQIMGCKMKNAHNALYDVRGIIDIMRKLKIEL